MLAFCILGVHVSCLYFWYKVENQSSTQQTCSKMNTYMSHRGGMKRKNPTLCSCVLNNFRHSSLQLFIFQKPSNASCWQRVHSNVISARVGPWINFLKKLMEEILKNDTYLININEYIFLIFLSSQGLFLKKINYWNID